MSKFGRLQAKITIPAGGWSFTMSITGFVGTSVRTIVAGAYWPSELVAAFETEWELGEVALGNSDGLMVTTSIGETGTGLVLLDYTRNFAITWDSTDLRDALGFTGNLSGADNYAATVVLSGIWLPHAILSAPRHIDDGHRELDRTIAVSRRGHVTALGYGEGRRRLGRVTWSHVQARYAIESQETTTGESFERWWLQTHGGRVSFFGRAPLVRLYWDADAGTYVEMRLVEPRDTWNPERVVTEWVGLWPVVIDGYKVPS